MEALSSVFHPSEKMKCCFTSVAPEKGGWTFYKHLLSAESWQLQQQRLFRSIWQWQRGTIKFSFLSGVFLCQGQDEWLTHERVKTLLFTQLNICLHPLGSCPSACWCPTCGWQALRVPGLLSCSEGHSNTMSNAHFQGAFQRQCARSWKMQRRGFCFPLLLAALCLTVFIAISKSLWSQRAQNQTNCIQGISFHHCQAPLKAQTDLFPSSGASHSAKYNSVSWFSWEETPQWNFFHNFTSFPKHGMSLKGNSEIQWNKSD